MPTAIPAFAPALSVEDAARASAEVEEGSLGREDAIVAMVLGVLVGFDEPAKCVDGNSGVAAAEEEVVWLMAVNLALTSANLIAF